jgi:N-acetylglutamate synthase-like GNAT family acetyltransferase
MMRLRRATQKDAAAIRALIHTVGINPTGLDWKRFLVAVDELDHVIASGQIKPHGDGTRELASIATFPEYRSQGLASAIIQRLVVETPHPLYLVCLEHNGSFYARFGFRELAPHEMPPILGREAKVVAFMRRFFLPKMERMLVMKID